MIDIFIEDFEGEIYDKMTDKYNLLHDIIDYSYNDLKINVLKYIDFYDDTTFNSYMIKACLIDIQHLRKKIEILGSDKLNVLNELETMCHKTLEKGAHVYLKFYGD